MRFLKRPGPYIVAEIGANHNGDLELARRMIAAAREAGCDCVKFQSFDTRLFAREVYEKSRFLGGGRDVKEDLKSAVEKYSVGPRQLEILREHCRHEGLDFASSAFEADQARELDRLDAAFIKLASMDLTNDPLLRAAAAIGRPLVLSTGMGSLSEIAHAVETLEAAGRGREDLALLHCVSLYPAPDEEVRLATLDLLRDTFGLQVGFSDHTLGTAVAVAAVARGAFLVEKHFTLDKQMEGWDHALSADPPEMAALVRDARRAHAAVGTPRRAVSEAEAKMRPIMRRSIVSARAIPRGQRIEQADLTYRRPGTGLPPNLTHALLGLPAARDIPADTRLSLEDLGRAPT